jgi:uroporphyrinogen-III synthase
MTSRNVLSTKKLEPLLIEKAKENGIEITEAQMIQVVPVGQEEWQYDVFQLFTDKNRTVVFTSSNAVTTFGRFLAGRSDSVFSDLAIFCLSGKTLKEVELQKIPGRILGTAADAKQLAEKITESGTREVVFFCGDRRRDELPSLLAASGIKVHEVVLYQTLETPVVVREGYDAVLFFSPSAVRSFFSANTLPENVICFAVGGTTARTVGEFGSYTVVTSASSSQEKMMETVFDYFGTNHNGR